jgi:hypothetical protein
MIRILNIRVAVVEVDERQKQTDGLKKNIIEFLDNIPFPLCYSIKPDFIEPSEIKINREKNERSDQNSNQKNKVADL